MPAVGSSHKHLPVVRSLFGADMVIENACADPWVMSNFVAWHGLSFDALAVDVIAVGRHSLSETIDDDKSDRTHEVSNTMEGSAPPQQHHHSSTMEGAGWQEQLGMCFWVVST